MAGKRGREPDGNAAPPTEGTPEKKQRLDPEGSATSPEKRASQASAVQAAPAAAAHTSIDAQPDTGTAAADAAAPPDANGSSKAAEVEQPEESSSDDEPLLPSRGGGGGSVKRGSECPYLDTVSRQVRAPHSLKPRMR